MTRNITEIIIHCSATIEGKHFTAGDINRWHRQRGFTSIGYHYVILLNGEIQQGRDLQQIGAHCKGHNRQSIGICYIGGLDNKGIAKDTRTPKQKDSLYRLLQSLKRQFPDAHIVGHNNFANKDCPCFDAEKEYSMI